MTDVIVAITRLPHGRDLPLPAAATVASAGCDLIAAISETVPLSPGERIRVPTGVAIALPLGFEAQVRPRSGLADRFGITLLNSPGTIDADYRGEIQVLLINLGREVFHIERGARIAQLIIAPVARAQWREVAALTPTARGDGGFGSTGYVAERPKTIEE